MVPCRSSKQSPFIRHHKAGPYEKDPGPIIESTKGVFNDAISLPLSRHHYHIFLNALSSRILQQSQTTLKRIHWKPAKMRRKANESLPPLNMTKASFQRKEERAEADSDLRTPTLLFPAYPQSPSLIDRAMARQSGSYRTSGGMRSFDACDTVKSSPKRNLRHVRSAITTNDISEPTLIEKKKNSADDPFYAAHQTRNVFNPISAPQSPKLTNFYPHSLAKDDGKRNQEPHFTKIKLHQRGRTDPSVPLSTIKARNVLDPKRWSTLFSSRNVTAVQANHATHQTTQTHFKRFGKTSSPRLEEAWQQRLPESPRKISHPFSISAAPGSALGKAITSSGNFISMSPAVSSNGTLVESTGHDAERILFNLDLQARMPILQSTHSPLNDTIHPNSSFDERQQQKSSLYGPQLRRSTFGSRSSGRYTEYHEPIEDVLEEYLLQDEEDGRTGRQEEEERITASFSEGNSLYYTPGEASMISESQTFATCHTSLEGRTMSARSASTPAFVQDGDRSAASSDLMDRSLIQTNGSDAFFTTPSRRTRDLSLQALGSVRSNDSTIEDWGSRPEGLWIETGDELSTKLKAMLTDQGERNRQSRLRAWREHARSGSHREAALQALLAQQKQYHQESFDTDIQPAYHRVRVSDFLHIREEAPAKTDLQRYLQASGAEKKQEHHNTSEANEDDYGSTYLDSTMDATSVLENDSESVEIRTAWRGKVDQYQRFENGSQLRSAFSTESFDMPKSEGKLIPSDSSYSPVLRPSNIPRRKHPKKPSLLQLSEAEENQNYTGEVPVPRRIPKNPNRAATCVMGVQDSLVSPPRSLPQSTSETGLADEAIGFDLCAHLLQRARESRSEVNSHQ
ncbi:uncharacterized protein FA14DRAFT_77331 [Meira miltonrushii]|uniref:Uncharacterized protein n=1 Tax=Meira miltonrushii TaxID=1280837 RepID=A0A316V5C5_9BASI|nr:uncharacterized protein FA14DRAFT_77331 [Meira miltonrushii]PWN32750.1 hypothetical protein FA14DRAFT_77331 [Meira miltonrushii]